MLEKYGGHTRSKNKENYNPETHLEEKDKHRKRETESITSLWTYLLSGEAFFEKCLVLKERGLPLSRGVKAYHC